VPCSSADETAKERNEYAQKVQRKKVLTAEK